MVFYKGFHNILSGVWLSCTRFTTLSNGTHRHTVDNGADGLKAGLGDVDELAGEGWRPHQEGDETVKKYWQETDQRLGIAVQICHTGGVMGDGMGGGGGGIQ